MSSTLTRRCAVLLLPTAMSVLVAAPAGAEVPEGWSEPPEVTLLQLLVLTVGIPLVLALLISLAVLVPALARGQKLLPSTETPDRWFGGPRESAAALTSGREVGPTGGASGRW